MKELKTLSKPELIFETKAAILEERKATTRILFCFREIETRMLHAEQGFPSLHEMAIKFFGLSEGAAHRRISAMRLLKEVPELAPALEEGRLSLSVASTVQDFFRAEKRANKKTYVPSEKLQLLKQMEGKSKRDCERQLRAISPHPETQEQTRILSDKTTEVRFVMTKELEEKLIKLRGLLAHQTKGDSSYLKLFSVLADIALEKVDPAEKQTKTVRKTSPERLDKIPSRYVPARVNQEVWHNAQGQCEYVDAETGRRCESKWGLERDHVVPFAKGGATETSNLRLCCSLHNTLAAIQAYGREKMKSYVPALAE
ncbi:DUF222 domain-containing protein [Bdellovibrionota bacterium FG-2]